MATTSRGARTAVLARARMKNMASLTTGMSSLGSVPGWVSSGRSKFRTVLRPRTTYAIWEICAASKPGVRYRIQGRRRSVGVNRIRKE